MNSVFNQIEVARLRERERQREAHRHQSDITPRLSVLTAALSSAERMVSFVFAAEPTADGYVRIVHRDVEKLMHIPVSVMREMQKWVWRGRQLKGCTCVVSYRKDRRYPDVFIEVNKE